MTIKQTLKNNPKLKYVTYFLLVVAFAISMIFPDWVRDHEMLLTVTAVPLIVLTFLFSQPKDKSDGESNNEKVPTN